MVQKPMFDTKKREAREVLERASREFKEASDKFYKRFLPSCLCKLATTCVVLTLHVKSLTCINRRAA